MGKYVFGNSKQLKNKILNTSSNNKDIGVVGVEVRHTVYFSCNL